MRNLLFWASLPFLAPQALYVRKTAPRFAGAAGANRGVIGQGEPLKLLAVGDSIIAGVGAREYPKALVGQTALRLSQSLGREVRWTAHGYIGANSTKLLDDHLPGIEDLFADVVITSVGINDVTSMTTLPRWRDNVTQLLARIFDHSPETLVAFAGLPPLDGFPLLPQPLRTVLGVRAAHFDRVARDVVNQFERVIYVPVEFETTPDKFAADGYHPNEASYVTYGAGMAEKIVERLVNE